MRGGAFLKGKEGRVGFRKTSLMVKKDGMIIPPSHSSPSFLAYPHPAPYPQPHSMQAATAEPRSAAEPAHSGFLESPIHYPQSEFIN